jgi:hypothetical protein
VGKSEGGEVSDEGFFWLRGLFVEEKKDGETKRWGTGLVFIPGLRADWGQKTESIR